MYKIVKKENLNPTVTKMVIDAPLGTAKGEPGQFIILRVDENGERIPLTVADYDRKGGTVTIIFQIVGATTEKLNALSEGEYIRDFVGPLGRATETEGRKKVAVIGISTPESFVKSTPTYFQDKDGNYIYTFAEGNNG